MLPISTAFVKPITPKSLRTFIRFTSDRHGLPFEVGRRPCIPWSDRFCSGFSTGFVGKEYYSLLHVLTGGACTGRFLRCFKLSVVPCCCLCGNVVDRGGHYFAPLRLMRTTHEQKHLKWQRPVTCLLF